MSEQTRKNREEILTALRSGICMMTYTKLDGEVRNVSGGTLNSRFIPPEKLPKNIDATKGTISKAPTEDSLVHYFDLAACGWRCFFPENLQSLVLGGANERR